MLTPKQKALSRSLDSRTLSRLSLLTGEPNASKIQIDNVIIDGYYSYTYLDAKTYGGNVTPTRSVEGSINNLNSYVTFLTPTVTINFKYMKIETYRAIMKLIQQKNEFVVTCYDVVWDRMVTRKMYFATEEAPELFKRGLTFLAAIDYTVELIGTNADLSLVSIVYHSNPPASTGQSDITQSGAEEFVAGEEVLIGDISSATGTPIQQMTFNGAYTFNGWNTSPDGTGTPYGDNQAYIISDNAVDNGTLVLYAQWKPSTMYTLSYNYGLGSTYVDSTTGEELLSKQIEYGTAYGTLPTTSVPPIIYNDTTYDNVYDFKGWYRTPTIGTGSTQITANTLYTTQGNSTLYQIFEPKKFTITYNANGGNLTPPPTTMPYDTTIALPNYITKENSTLKGWKNSVTGAIMAGDSMVMPPTNITLTAEWE